MWQALNGQGKHFQNGCQSFQDGCQGDGYLEVGNGAGGLDTADKYSGENGEPDGKYCFVCDAVLNLAVCVCVCICVFLKINQNSLQLGSEDPGSNDLCVIQQ